MDDKVIRDFHLEKAVDQYNVVVIDQNHNVKDTWLALGFKFDAGQEKDIHA